MGLLHVANIGELYRNRLSVIGARDVYFRPVAIIRD